MAITRADLPSERQPLLSKVSDSTNDNDSDQHASSRDGLGEVSKEHEHLLIRALYPLDSFDHHTYWADLSARERAIWIKDRARKEIKREWNAVSTLAKAGLTKPFKAYLSNYAVVGVGFFVEGYVLFSVGNVMPLFKAVWPRCWDDNEVCDAQTIKSIKYLEILGIISGQITIGFLGDAIGRRWGLIQDAGTMLVGTILLIAMWGASLQGWTIMYAVAIFVFGLGVGGEYPMTSTSAIEGLTGPEDRNHRGRKACLAFLMQGWGQLANQLVLIVLTIASSSSHSLQPPYSKLQTHVTFRVSFFIAALCLVYFLYLRVFKMKNLDDRVKENRQERKISSGYDWNSFRFVLSRFWARLFAASACWFCSDFAFYGMQVFRNTLIELVTDSSSQEVGTIWLYNLINIGCQLIGYYLAALLVDHKSYGRYRMQLVGFGAQFALYVTISIAFPVLVKAGTGAKLFQAMYFLISFWVQFGPNSTTFLLAAEIFPVGVRSTAHGFSAAVGKIGALVATVLYNYVDDRTKFILAAVFALLGMVFTVVFVPDTTGLDLAEMQRAWRFVADGEPSNYHGIAVHTQHLSWFEKNIRGRQRAYDLVHDRGQRLKELRKLYERSIAEMQESHHEGDIDEEMVKYFELEKAARQRSTEVSSRGYNK